MHAISLLLWQRRYKALQRAGLGGFCYECVELYPTFLEQIAGDNTLRHVELRLLSGWVITEIDGLGISFRIHGAPRLAPEPFLRQRKHWDVPLDVIRQVLVKI